MAGIALAAAPAMLQADWRKDLLKERGVGLDKASLQKAAAQNQLADQELQKAFGQLGSDEFKERERAQMALSEAGEQVLDFLDSKEPIEDPEVRVRVGEIRRAVNSGAKTRMGPIVRHAAKSLLENPEDPTTGGLFFEGFGADKENCFEGYRSFVHEGGKSFEPFVKDGLLNIPGRHGDEEDQRFSLTVNEWPGGKKLPNRFQVSCLMGGAPAGAGVWHVGLCVGKVKALFHPGFNGGGFRFEEVGTLEKFTQNDGMGFTPEFGKLYRTEMTVSRFPSGRVGIKIMITSPEGKTFQSHVQVEAEDAGPLDRISLERSGRRGGNAFFDDLQIKILP